MKRRFASLYALALVPALLLAGCGDEETTTGIPLDTTPPLSPVLEGTSGEDGWAYVWWKSNTEPDLDGYFVYEIRDGQPHRLNDFAQDSNYMSIEAESGVVYVYVTAIDFSGNESSPSTTGKVHVNTVPDARTGADDGFTTP